MITMSLLIVWVLMVAGALAVWISVVGWGKHAERAAQARHEAMCRHPAGKRIGRG